MIVTHYFTLHSFFSGARCTKVNVDRHILSAARRYLISADQCSYMLLGLYVSDVQVVHKLAALVTSNISKTVLVELHLQQEVVHAVSKVAIFNCF